MTDFKLNNVENIDRLSVLNDNFDKIEEEFNDNTLKRDGSRDMKGALNANGNRIFNLPDPVDNKDVATVEYVLKTATGVDIVSGVASVNGRTGSVGLTKEDVQLENVDNTSDLDKPVSTATQSALNNKINVGEAVASVNGRSGDVVLTRQDVNLNNVNNTSDMDKPISTAQKALFFQGWEYVNDDGSAQTFDTTYSQLTINGGGEAPNVSNQDFLPSGVDKLWDLDTNRIVPDTVGDCYTIRVRFNVTGVSGTPDIITAALDISGDGSFIIFEDVSVADKSVPYGVSFDTSLFTLDTFVEEGARIIIKTDAESVTLDKPNIFIQRTFSPVL